MVVGVWFLYILFFCIYGGWIFGMLMFKIDVDFFGFDYGFVKYFLCVIVLVYMLLDVDGFEFSF